MVKIGLIVAQSPSPAIWWCICAAVAGDPQHCRKGSLTLFFMERAHGPWRSSALHANSVQIARVHCNPLQFPGAAQRRAQRRQTVASIDNGPGPHRTNAARQARYKRSVS